MSFIKITSSTVLTAPTEASALNNSTVFLSVDSTSGAISITLPALSTLPGLNTTYVINDVAGTAATNNITIIANTTVPDLINNAASVVLNQNGQNATVKISNLNDWQFISSGGGLQNVAITATSDGLTTGIIANGNVFAAVTSASANNIVTLPAAVPGTTVWLNVTTNGYKLQTTSPTTIAINGGTGAGAKSAVGANIFLKLTCNSATTWISESFTTAGVQAAGAVAL